MEQLIVIPTDESNIQSVLPSVQSGVGGIILYGSIAPADLGAQVASLVAQAPGGIRPAVMTDEEGGEVQRMPNLVGSLPWPRTMAETMTPPQVRQLAIATARNMATAGLTVDLAPVLDLVSESTTDATNIDGPRSFSPNATVVSDYGLAFAQGLEAGGITPVVKQFPGEGAATGNTDDGPASTPPVASLEASDLLPFEAAIRAGLPAIMVGNASVPGLTSIPSSLSSAVITGLLRSQLGFRGLVMTDSLSAGSIADAGLGVPGAAVDALAAGADMILFNATDPNAMTQQIVTQVVTAVATGILPTGQLNQAVAQVLDFKHIDLCPPKT